MSFTSSFSWDVELPTTQKTSFSQKKPRAYVHIESETHGSESIAVVASVGKALIKDREHNSFNPEGRSELLYHLRELSEEHIAKKTEDLICRRDYSAKELKDKLLNEGYRLELVERQVSRAQEYGLVDDERFAELFIRSKLAQGWGKRKILLALEKKGIDSATLNLDAFEEMGASTQYERAKEMAQKKRLSGKNDYEKLVRFLVTKGYDFNLAKRVALERASESE